MHHRARHGGHSFTNPIRRWDIRTYFGEAFESEEVGAGTHYPFGFTLAQIDEIFYQTKKFQITGDLPGQEATQTFLWNTNGAYPSDGLRQHMFAQHWWHLRNNVDPGLPDNKYIPLFEVKRYGVRKNDLYYPYVDCYYLGEEGGDEDEDEGGGGEEGEEDDVITGNYSIIDTNQTAVGAVTFLGVSTPLYPMGEPFENYNPPGSISITSSEKWTV